MRDRIETNRLVLRQFDKNDLNRIAAYAGNVKLARATGRLPHPYTLADAEEWLDYTQSPETFDHIYAVADLHNQLMGCVSLMSNGSEKLSTWELGYWLGQEHWHKGFMREASTALLAEARRSLAPVALSAVVFIDNPRSHALLHFLGFEVSSTCTQFSFARGREVEAYELSLSLEAVS